MELLLPQQQSYDQAPVLPARVVFIFEVDIERFVDEVNCLVHWEWCGVVVGTVAVDHRC